MWDHFPETEVLVCEVFGPEGSGKTHFATTWPNPVFADTEGRAHLVLRKRGITRWKKIATWDDLRRVSQAAVEAVPAPATFVVDSGSDLQSMAEEAWLQESGKENVYPRVLWGQIFEKLDAFILFWREVGWNLVITERMKPEFDPTIRTPTGQEGAYTGRLIPDRYKKVPYKADVVLELVPGLVINGEVISRRTVARVLKTPWTAPWETKPYLIDVSYEGMMRELTKPWRGTMDDIIREIRVLDSRETAARLEVVS